MIGLTGVGRLPLLVGLLAIAGLLAGGLFAPVEARNSAPFGFDMTIDFTRSPAISVSGRTIVPNYPNLNRLDLDLRAYQHGADYDLTVHIRPDTPGATDIRTIPLDLKGTQIPDNKPAFMNPFVTVSFPTIHNSAGSHYYVWIEPGIRNRDNVIALWSIKSYSRVTGRDILGAFLNTPPTHRAHNLFRGVMLVILAAVVLTFGWLMAGATALALSLTGKRREKVGVASPRRRWYTVPRLTRDRSDRAARTGVQDQPGSEPASPAGTGAEVE